MLTNERRRTENLNIALSILTMALVFALAVLA